MGPIERLRSSPRPIAFSIDSGTQVISGVTTWMQGLVKRLHADGVPVVVLLHHIGGGIERSSIGSPLQAAGITVDIEERASTLEVDVKGTLAFLKRHRPAVYLPNCLNSMYFAAAIAGDQGLPWVLTMHSDDPDYWAIARAIPPESHRGRMVCVSRHLHALALERNAAERPVMIPYGARVGERQAQWKDAPFRVVYSGRLVETQKRLSLVVDVMVMACRKDARVECMLMGDGPARSMAERKVQDAGLADRICFTGRLGPDEVRERLCNAQVMLLMSDYEGLPVALLEAMALGVVPVVRHIPSGIPELVTDGFSGMLVGEEVGAASDAIVRLANDQALWETCSRGAYERVAEGYSEEGSYSNWLAFLADMVDEGPTTDLLQVPDQVVLPPHDQRLDRGYAMATATATARPIPSMAARIKGLLRRFWK